MKTINYTVRFLVLAVIAFLVALAISTGAKSIQAQGNSVMATYKINYHTVQSVADGSQPTEEWNTTVSRRSNGDEFTSHTPPGIREVGLYSRGLRVAINEKAALVMTYGNGKAVDMMPTHPFGANCETFSSELKGESRNILEFRVLKLVSAPNETLAEKRESWLAPDLNCEPLLETTQWLTNGKVYSTTTKTATSASQTPASDDLFAIPVGYTEVPPSTFWPAAGHGFSQKNVDAYNRDKALRAGVQTGQKPGNASK